MLQSGWGHSVETVIIIIEKIFNVNLIKTLKDEPNKFPFFLKTEIYFASV